MRAGDDKTCAGFGDEIVRAFRQPLLIELHRAHRFSECRDGGTERPISRCAENFPSKRMDKRRNLTRWTTQTMIRHRAGERETILHDVEAIHRVLRRAYATPRGKCA